MYILQVHMQEQIASIKASIERHPTFENETDQCPTNVGMQKRKLYFSAGNSFPSFFISLGVKVF